VSGLDTGGRKLVRNFDSHPRCRVGWICEGAFNHMSEMNRRCQQRMKGSEKESVAAWPRNASGQIYGLKIGRISARLPY